MSSELIPLDTGADAPRPDPDAVLTALQAPSTGEGAPPEGPEGEPDADKLARAKPGRKRSPISKHRTKPELLAAAREQEARIRELETQLGVTRPSDAPAAPAADVLKSVTSALDATLLLGCKLLAAYRGDHWDLADAEREALRDAWVPILAHYAPQIGPALPWLNAVGVTAVFVLPRLGKDAELAKGRAALTQAPEAVPVTTQGQTMPDPPVAQFPNRHQGGPV